VTISQDALAWLLCNAYARSQVSGHADVALEISVNFEAGETMAFISPAGLVCPMWQVVTHCGSAIDYFA
jgi:hypothetical protein